MLATCSCPAPCRPSILRENHGFPARNAVGSALLGPFALTFPTLFSRLFPRHYRDGARRHGSLPNFFGCNPVWDAFCGYSAAKSERPHPVSVPPFRPLSGIVARASRTAVGLLFRPRAKGFTGGCSVPMVEQWESFFLSRRMRAAGQGPAVPRPSGQARATLAGHGAHYSPLAFSAIPGRPRGGNGQHFVSSRKGRSHG